jgi:hypothetical protein
MKNSKSIVSVFSLLAFSIISIAQQTHDQPYPINDRQVSVILQRLERSSNRFRNSLNAALIQGRIDQTRPQNDINSFIPAFERASGQFRDQFTRGRASTTDVQNLLQKASLINGFMARNRLNRRVQNDWTSVRTELDGLANSCGVGRQWNPPALPRINSNSVSRLSDSELNLLIQRIEAGEDKFRSSLTDAFGQSRYDQTTSEANMNDAVRDLQNAIYRLQNQFEARQPLAEHVGRVLARATPIDSYMRSNPLTNTAQNDWSTLREELIRLAGAYNLSANWPNRADLQTGFNSNRRLTGTFRLNSLRSDHPREMIDRATRNLPDNERQDVHDQIIVRLESPQLLAIERRGSTVTIASSLAPQATFEADARERQEQLGNNRSTRVTATLRGDQLVVSSNGYRENDFNVTFDATENERSLRVRRQIYSDRLTQPVVVDSVYDRTSDAAQWSVYTDSGTVLTHTGSSHDEFILRDGEMVVAVLNNDLTTKQTKEGDRFTITVREPGQHEGAVIEGTVGSVDQGGRLTGRAGMMLSFDTIQLRDGQTYKFAGILGSVRMLNGDTVKVGNEGSAQGENQTTQTIQRAAIGTAIGAIVGAVAGCGKGAAIGGIIGAAGGAGSVYVQGKDSLELPNGTELTIRSGAPR